jgi:hypothetical protein
VTQGGSGFVELVKLVGGIAGLATAAFTIWDRFTRGWPLAFVILEGSKDNPFFYLRIKNLGVDDILIADIVAWPRRIKVSASQSLNHIYHASMGDRPVSIIASDEHNDFPIIMGDELASLANKKVWFFIKWRRISMTWLPLPCRVSGTSRHKLIMMIEAHRKQWSSG